MSNPFDDSGAYGNSAHGNNNSAHGNNDNAYGNKKSGNSSSGYGNKRGNSSYGNKNSGYGNSRQEQEQQTVEDIEKDTMDSLAKSIGVLAQTEEMGADTLGVLHQQGKQLERIDQELYETEETLQKSKHTLKGMKTWTSAFTGYFKKKPEKRPYASPDDNREETSYKGSIPKNEAMRQVQDESAEIVKKGFLNKLGAKVKSWKTRYCILKLNGEFLYYSDEKEKTLKGQALFDHSTIVVELYEDSKTRFDVTDGSKRTWTFEAPSEKECEGWCDALTKPKKVWRRNELLKVSKKEAQSADVNSFDDGLDDILAGIQRLQQIASDAGQELKYHDQITTSIDDRMETVRDEVNRQQIASDAGQELKYHDQITTS